LVAGGVKGIWNFSPAHLDVPDDVIVENIHLTDSLLRLSFRLNERSQRSGD
jgi:redox-sensing transcriptional repressor